MSYRITARDYELGEDYSGDGKLYHQLYGNNQSPKLIDEWVKSQGSEVDGDRCFRDVEIKDIQEFLEVMVKVQDELVEDDTWYDFKPMPHMKTDNPDRMISYWGYKLDVATVLIVYNFYKAFESLLETEWDDSIGGVKYKIKEGKHIYLSGF